MWTLASILWDVWFSRTKGISFGVFPCLYLDFIIFKELL